MNYRTPLKNVRGYGASRSGVRHFIGQRVSAILLALIVPWFLYSVTFAIHQDYENIRRWVALPWNAALLVAFFGAGTFHMQLGMQTVAEDYTNGILRHLLLILNVFGAFAVSILAILSILGIAFTGFDPVSWSGGAEGSYWHSYGNLAKV